MVLNLLEAQVLHLSIKLKFNYTWTNQCIHLHNLYTRAHLVGHVLDVGCVFVLIMLSMCEEISPKKILHLYPALAYVDVIGQHIKIVHTITQLPNTT